MNFKMKTNILTALVLCCLHISCNDENQSNSKSDNVLEFQNKGHELVYSMTQKVGTYDKLHAKKNVSYTYSYQTPDGKADISTEKYIFDGELSYGHYKKHERTFPQLDGVIEQGFDGDEYWLKHNGEILSDQSLLKRVAFNRPTNFYWFTMMQKLMDPGLNYECLGEKTIDHQNYDVVKISFKSPSDKPTDIYQVYINKKTLMVDQFLFTVADFGKMDIPFLMKLKYEEIEGLLIPTIRQYKQSTWNADVTDEPWIKVTWSDVKFNTEMTKKDFTK